MATGDGWAKVTPSYNDQERTDGTDEERTTKGL